MGKGVRPKTCISPASAVDSKQGRRDQADDAAGGRRNSDPRGFANPTLSSLIKIKPVAIIRAYDDITDHKSLLDKTRVLEKLRNTQIRSPLLDLRRLELEELVNTKSFEVINTELDTIIHDAQSFVLELSARYGDAAYRLDLANSWDTLDDATRMKAVENFAAGAEERARLVSDLESKLRLWKETIENSKKILKVTSSDPPLSQIGQLIEKAEQVTEEHQKSCFMWSSKITHVNVQVMCHYFQQLAFNAISNVCTCQREFDKMVERYGMKNMTIQTNVFQEMGSLLARESAPQIRCLFSESDSKPSLMKKVTFAQASSCTDLFQQQHSPDDMEQGISLMSFENILNLIILHNERILLRLIFARFTPDEMKTKKKTSARKTWKIGDWAPDEKGSCIQDMYKESDEAFWSLFWAQFTDPLVRVFMDHDVAVWPPLLDQIRNVCLSINDLSIPALTSLSKAYTQLFRIYSEHTWSNQHRKMIHAMEELDSSNPATLLTEDKLSTVIGSFALLAVDPIVVLIRDCESGSVADESLHCLTLSINTLINWINCEDMSNWPLAPAVTLIWGDLQSLSHILKSLGEAESVAQFERDVRGVRASHMEHILSRVSQNSRTLVKRNMPRSEYRSRICKSTPAWMLECFDEAVSEVIGALSSLSMQRGTQVQFVSAFLDGCLAEMVQDPVKFSQSGAREFAHDAEEHLSGGYDM